MARGLDGGSTFSIAGSSSRSKFSFKKTTFVVCSISVAALLYLLHSLSSSFVLVSSHDRASFNPFRDFKYTEEQLKIMDEYMRIRKESRPSKLISLVEVIRQNLSSEDVVSSLPQHLKQRLSDEVIQRLKDINGKPNVTEREALETWRKAKMEEVKKLTHSIESTNSSEFIEEAVLLMRALESGWTMLLEDMGLYLPVEIVNKEDVHTLEMEKELENQIIPGRPIPPECHAEKHTDYAGAAVRWGLTHHVESAADCCQACIEQAKGAKPDQLKCNIWVYCPVETGCHSPDIYEHKHQECWLKQAEQPKLNFKETYPESYRNEHPTAPVTVPWISGIISL